VASFGEKLRQARESRKITLQEIADTTKIGTRSLQALESDRFDQLPGGIFNKGFVRSYARFVGLDEDKTVAEYVAAAKAAAPDVDLLTMSAQSVTEKEKAERQSWSPNGATVVGVLAIIVAVGMGALWLNERRKDARETAAQGRTENSMSTTAPQSTPAPTAPTATTDPNAGTVQPTTPNGTQPEVQGATQGVPQNAAPNPAPAPVVTKTEQASKESGAPVEISISATEKAWISVRSDGKNVESITLDPDKADARTRSYSAKEKLLLVVGNPAGLSITYNGKPAGTLGSEGHRATITFTPEGIEKH
jgi:cytoskeleton protein RodZ